jgi:Tol biopolymer transport system component
LWAFLTSKYGDDILKRVLRSKNRNVAKRLEDATGHDVDALTAAWHESLVPDRTDADGVDHARRIPGLTHDGARLHVAPSLSPDGRELMFVSERDRLSLDLFMTDAESGSVVRKIVSMAADPHFDSLQYISSSGAWDADGRRFAMSVLREGAPTLVIMNTSSPSKRNEISLPGMGEIYNPSWSPDGTRIVFSVLKGGLSDLFVYTLETGGLRQLTADAYADLQPVWSPDGRSIAFTTDRFTSTLEDLRFGALRIGLLDLETNLIRPVYVDSLIGKQVSAQWSPDSRAVYFISDRTGVSNVYRVDLVSGELRRVTNVAGGVTGITSTSPALAVASRAGTLAFSVYTNGRYEIQTLPESAALAAPVVDSEETTPPAQVNNGMVDRLLADSLGGLPTRTRFPTSSYDDRLRLESFTPPFIGGVMGGGGFGGALRATIGMSFADMLRDRQLITMFRVGSDVENLAAQAAYSNRRGLWNWGFAGGVLPSRFVGAKRAIDRVDALITRETAHLRYSNQWARLTAHYHLSRTQRIEMSAGVRHTGFEWQTITRVIDAGERRTISESLKETAAGRGVTITEAAAAFVHDGAVSGPTSPISGKRLRLEIQPALGGLSFADVLVDARRYFMPVRPVTVAIRTEHLGRYGPDAGDARLAPLVLGLPAYVRGYDLRSFAVDECGRAATTCSPLDELTGGRLALVNIEVRAPLLGILRRDLYYGRVPLEAFMFADAGFLWTHHGDAQTERDRFRSAGVGGRVNLGGIVLEVAAARPLDRGINHWKASLLLRPGW